MQQFQLSSWNQFQFHTTSLWHGSVIRTPVFGWQNFPDEWSMVDM